MAAALAYISRKVSLRSVRDLEPHLRNIGHLLSGNVAGNILALVSLAIAARALDPTQFGVLAMIITYVRLVERLIRFEAWQPLIHFASYMEDDRRETMPRLYLLGMALDVLAAILACVSAICIAYLFGYLIGLPAEALALVAIYSISVLFNLTGVPTASLRLAGRFKTIAYVQPIAPAVRIPLALACWYFSSDLTSFVIAWLLAQVIGSGVFVFAGYRILFRDHGLRSFLVSPRGLLKEFPGFIGFAWSSNLSMTAKTVTQEVDTLLVGLLAGPGSAGFYHVAKRLAKVAQQVGAHTQAVLYPDMARLWAARSFAKLRSLTLRVQLILSGIGLCGVIVALVVGRPFLELTLGEDFAGAAPLLVAQLVAVTLILHGAPSRSILLSMGKPQIVLHSSLVAMVAFLICTVLLVPQIGAMGAAIGQIVFAAITAVWTYLVWIRNLADQRKSV